MDMTIDPALTSAADEHDALAAVPSFLQKSAALDVTEIFGGIGASVAQEPTPVSTLTMPAGHASDVAQVVPACTFPAGLEFSGNATFPCDFAVQGVIDGKIELTGQSKLVIARGGKVNGEIVSKCIRIDGEAHGTINAAGGVVSFGEHARGSGTIHYARMAMSEGAEVEATMKKVA